ncbi:MAG: Flp family type IVb pilin [Gammaproteobacteria bacterium]
MINAISRFVFDEAGLTTVEYAVAGALITVALVGAFTLLAGSVSNTMLTIDAILPG